MSTLGLPVNTVEGRSTRASPEPWARTTQPSLPTTLACVWSATAAPEEPSSRTAVAADASAAVPITLVILINGPFQYVNWNMGVPPKRLSSRGTGVTGSIVTRIDWRGQWDSPKRKRHLGWEARLRTRGQAKLIRRGGPFLHQSSPEFTSSGSGSSSFQFPMLPVPLSSPSVAAIT